MEYEQEVKEKAKEKEPSETHKDSSGFNEGDYR